MSQVFYYLSCTVAQLVDRFNNPARFEDRRRDVSQDVTLRFPEEKRIECGRPKLHRSDGTVIFAPCRVSPELSLGGHKEVTGSCTAWCPGDGAGEIHSQIFSIVAGDSCSLHDCSSARQAKFSCVRIVSTRTSCSYRPGASGAHVMCCAVCHRESVPHQVREANCVERSFRRQTSRLWWKCYDG